MSLADRRRTDIEATLHKLTLEPSHKRSNPRRPNPVADSWEDDDEDDADSTTTCSEPSPYGNNNNNNNSSNTNSNNSGTNVFPRAPPPTPSSPSGASPRSHWADFDSPYSPSLAGRMSDGLVSPARTSFAGAGTAARPEKQTAVAGRLIAGALGVRPPKKSDEQRQYEKAVKDNEMRRRDKERDAARRREEEAAKAKAAIWDD